MILASEPVAICGCDVAAPQAVRRPTTQPLHTFFRGFHRQFTRQEWEMIRGAGGEAEQEMVFRWVGRLEGSGRECWWMLREGERRSGGCCLPGQQPLVRWRSRHSEQLPLSGMCWIPAFERLPAHTTPHSYPTWAREPVEREAGLYLPTLSSPCPPSHPFPRCRKLWSLKEAFVKATGEGLGFDLGLLEFKITGSTGARQHRREGIATCIVWARRMGGSAQLRSGLQAEHGRLESGMRLPPPPTAFLPAAQPQSACVASLPTAGSFTCTSWGRGTGRRWRVRPWPLWWTPGG